MFTNASKIIEKKYCVNLILQVHAVVNRCARLKLKVQADAPILILPRKTTCPDILVANLGKLHVENQFLHSSNPNTNGFSFIASRSRTNCSDNNEDGMFLTFISF